MTADNKNKSIVNKLEAARKLTRNNGLTFNPDSLPHKKEVPTPVVPQDVHKEKDDVSIFHGKSEATRFQIKKELKKLNPRKYGLNLKSYQMADLEKLFPGRFGGTINHDEAKAAAKELYWQIKHEQTDSKDWKKTSQDRMKLKLLEDLIDDNSFRL